MTRVQVINTGQNKQVNIAKTMTATEVADKIRASALLVSIRLGSYNPIRTDKKEGRAVTNAHGVDSKLLKVQKNTMPTASVLEDIEKLDTRIRAVVDKFTAPFARGIGLLPATRFFDLRKEITPLMDDRVRLVARFADEYSILVDEARRDLKTIFNAGDYPPAAEVVRKFHAKLDSFSIGNPAEGKLGVLGELAQQIADAQEESLRDKFEGVTPYLVSQLLKPLRHQSSTLQNPDAKLYETTFSNVYEAADAVSHLNLLGDPLIQEVVSHIEDNLKVTKEDIKDDEHLRGKTLVECNHAILLLGGEIPPPAASKGKKAAPVVASVVAPVVAELAEEPAATPVVAEPAEEPADKAFNADEVLAKLGW